MIWIFERANESLRLETRFDHDTSKYLLITHHSGGSQDIERFDDVADFQTRLDALEKTIKSEHWKSAASSPILLRNGWKV